MKASGAGRWAILAIVSSAVFLIVVDMTVLHTALPTLTRDLGASASQTVSYTHLTLPTILRV